MSESYICLACGVSSHPKTITKGSLLIEIILWFCFLVPGLIYTIWRLTSRYKGCSNCGSTNIVPSSSPNGKAIVASQKDKAKGKSLNRNCPNCGEEIKRIAKLCKHCKSPVPQVFVDNPEANQQIILISELVGSGMSSQEIAVELQNRNVPCLGTAGRWDSTMVSGIIEDFSLAPS